MTKLSEKDVTHQVKGFMEYLGWRAVRMQRTIMKGQFQTGEPGMADWLFIYYGRVFAPTVMAKVIWIEIKSPGKTAKCRCATKKPRQRCTFHDQASWKAAEIARGAVVWTIDSLEALKQEFSKLPATYSPAFGASDGLIDTADCRWPECGDE